MSRRSADFHGLLIVDKPGADPQTSPRFPTATPPTTTPPNERLYTSHDIVQLARRWSHQRRIGHTGTLDPMASGVLVLCMGTATRLVEYYQGHDKQYYAEIALGVSTDTYDAMGKATATAPVPDLDSANIETVLAQFQGDILQRPPVYSALKQDGESLHRKARRGESVKIKPRPITVHTLDLVDWIKPDRLVVRLVCSAGTYVRSLAHDIGQTIGCGAHLALLRRERAGQFELGQAHLLAEIERASDEGNLADLLLPMGFGLDLPSVTLDGEQIKRLGHGQTVLVDESRSNVVTAVTHERAGWHADLLAQGHDDQGRFLGILRCLGPAESPSTAWRWKANKWLAAA